MEQDTLDSLDQGGTGKQPGQPERGSALSGQPAAVAADGGMVRFLVLGNKPTIIPGVDLSAKITSPYAAILLGNNVEASELSAALAQATDPAVPIADFGGNSSLRHDFAAPTLTPETFAEMRQHFIPIWRRLTEIPFRAEREDRSELATLRIAYSRDKRIEAVFTPDSRQIVAYPLLGRGAGIRPQLELLADVDLLRRTHFTRTHACSKCNSSRVNVYEACPKCGAADLVEEEIVHHYRCGAQEPQSHFVQGELLICPKCRRILRHFGKDYDKPGKVVVCRSCGAANSQPVVRFACLDCKAITDADEAVEANWYHYDLTDEGVHALREGRMPRFEIASLLERRTRAYSPQDFRLLVMQVLRVSQRYKRPFVVARLSFPNLSALRHEIGPLDTNAAFKIAVDAIVSVLRTSDFVGARGASSIVIGFPENGASDLKIAIDRVHETIRAATKVPIQVAVEVAEGDDIISMLAES